MNTVYIVGAGASVDANFPTGEELKHLISKDLAFKTTGHFGTYEGGGSETIVKALTNRNKWETAKSNFKEASKISKGVKASASIDNYIDIHRDNTKIAEIGKLAITKIIGEKEKKSLLFANYNNPLDINKVAHTWYNELVISLTTGCDFEQLFARFKKITFIIFNYDRCVEQALLHLLVILYDRQEDEVVDLLEQVTFIHPYGSLGKFPGNIGEKTHYFGNNIFDENLFEISQNIKTFTESIDSDIISKIKPAMTDGDRFIFLGFAFHPINMRLLSVEMSPDTRKRKAKIYATTLGMSYSDVKICESKLGSMFRDRRKALSPPNIDFNNIKGTCTELFREFNLSLGYE